MDLSKCLPLFECTNERSNKSMTTEKKFKALYEKEIILLMIVKSVFQLRKIEKKNVMEN